MVTVSPPIDRTAIDDLARRFRGELNFSGKPGYDEARTIYNAMIDRRPALIARCADIADVMTAVDFGRANDMTIAIRGGGHNVAGLALCDDGLVIDLSAMRGVRVDPARRRAHVQGGCVWGDVDHAAHPFGLATPTGIISTTGVGGLTLGGGFGYLSRRYGLSCDNLVSADVVTADGRFVTASRDEHPDLFWALRGGGGNFGVVTSFEFQLHPVSTVYGGLIFYPVEQTEQILRTFREYMRQAPDEVSAFFSFHQGPPAPFVPEHLHFRPMVTIVVCHSGDLARGEELIRPLREAGEILLDLVGPMPYPALNSMFDDLFSTGLYHYWKAGYVPTLTDGAIAVHAEHGPKVPSLHSTMHLYPQTGAIQRVGKHDTAYFHRDVEFVHNVVAIDMDAANMPRNMAWMRTYWEALQAHSSSGAYVNFMMADEGQERVRATYGDNYERLTRVKQQYDPDNLFRINQNIRPSG